MPAVTVQQAFELALQHHQAGRLAEAEGLYRQILAVQPNHADALHLCGVIAHQVSRNEVAIQMIGRAIALNPDNPSAHCNLGEAYRATGRMEEAIASYRRSIDLKADNPEALCNLGNVLGQWGRLDDAVAACREAVARRPDFVLALNKLASFLLQRGEVEEAHALFRRVLQLQPDSGEACNNLGGALRCLGRVEEAIAAFSEARRLQPDLPEAHENLGNALKDRGLFEGAVAAYLGLLQLRPEYPEGYQQLGIAYARLGQTEKALSAYENALRLQPDFPEALNNQGVALRERRQLPGAIESFRRALQLDPALPEAHNNLGNVLKDLGQLDEARQEFQTAIRLKPAYAEACNGLANILKDQACPEAALVQFRRALELAPGNAALHSNLICMLYYDPSQSAATIAEEQRRWNEKFCAPLRGRIPPHDNDRTPDRRLRIGYVSADFRDHVVGRYLLPLLRGHDHAAFEIFGYSGVACPDPLTEMLRRHVHHWRHCVGLSDEALSAMIRRDGVDILVDLSQHLSGNRLRVFAQQPAPVQVSFAGYPESTGVETIAYRISDRFLEPRWGEKENDRREEVLLVDTFMCYEPAENDVETQALPAGELGHVTFGNLNNFGKVNERALRVWARVLTAVKGSRLLFLSPRGSHWQQTVEFLGREGIEAQRIEFCEPRPRRQYLELYGQVDIALDPFPYNGHTTSLDALWMGVPVVSLAGQHAVGRAGLSQLTNLGLPELVADTEDEYVSIAAGLAGDLRRLAEMRATLRPRMEASVLMDAPRFARQIETAYRTMWRRWCAENPG